LSTVLRGLRGRCPRCGVGALFGRYLKPVATCANCGEAFDHIRADDFPPWLTIICVGHILVPLVLVSNRLGLSTTLELALWLPTALVLVLLLLPRFKGAIIGLMWSLAQGESELPVPKPAIAVQRLG
jgi:uncharacterized protein (DUF983 family)